MPTTSAIFFKLHNVSTKATFKDNSQKWGYHN